MSYNTNFRETGLPKPVLFASKTGAGTVIADPGAGKHIIIYEFLASANTTLKDGSGGTAYAINAPGGAAANLTGSIKLEANLEVYSTDGNVTITYTIV